jgi:hypothetical protein
MFADVVVGLGFCPHTHARRMLNIEPAAWLSLIGDRSWLGSSTGGDRGLFFVSPHAPSGTEPETDLPSFTKSTRRVRAVPVPALLVIRFVAVAEGPTAPQRERHFSYP